ncbi:putative F-box protein At1g23770 [Actinidia eriantha]|uniref:putative F-box protein At1g23770 n=1 Tax=Actinidia eriantha TaxID=165200 RepID=UPI00258E704F|nr:putative F-box protein At1g23770 [Actinidia eriantha]
MDIDDDGSKEVGEGGSGDHKLLVIAVHAVLLESGFVGFNSITKMKVERFYLPDEWPRSEFSVSLSYALPKIINQGLSEDGVETVFLKFGSLGKYVNVNGSLTRNGSRVYRVCLDDDRLSFFLNIMWANCDSIKEKNGKGSFSQLHPEREVFEFWRTWHAELLYLSSNDDLWKQKFVEQFGNVDGSAGGSHWKEKFAKSWETRKRMKTAALVRLSPLMVGPQIFAPRIIPDPNPLREPRIIGGDYDLGPAFLLGRSVRASPRQNVIPHCNLDGALKGNPGQATAGGLIRNSNGKWITGFHRDISKASSLEIEIWAIHDDLQLAANINLPLLHVEMDCTTAIQP